MRKGRFVQPTTVIAGLALFVSLAGGAFAARSVLIGSAQIKNHSINLVDMSPSAIRGLAGKRGPRGSQGVQGLPGPQGAQGASGANGGFDPTKVRYDYSGQTVCDSGATCIADGFCLANTLAIGGGFVVQPGAEILASTFDPAYHEIKVANTTGSSMIIRSTVICAAR